MSPDGKIRHFIGFVFIKLKLINFAKWRSPTSQLLCHPFDFLEGHSFFCNCKINTTWTFQVWYEWRPYFIANESQIKQYLRLTVLLCSILGRLARIYVQWRKSQRRNLICKKKESASPCLISGLYNFTLEFHTYRDGLILRRYNSELWFQWPWDFMRCAFSAPPVHMWNETATATR